MKNVIQFLIIISVLSLLTTTVYGQGPGAFNLANSTSCDVKVTIWAFDGECTSVDCGTAVDSIVNVAVRANTTSNVASGYTGSGDVWGRVKVGYLSHFTEDGLSNCPTAGNIRCSGTESVQWIDCHNASIP